MGTLPYSVKLAAIRIESEMRNREASPSIPMILKCPRCGKETESAGNPYRPFCSERCKLIDLGDWISGTYRISRKSEAEDEDGESPPQKDSEKE